MNVTFGVGSVLGTGIRVWIRNLIPFLLITALCDALPWLWIGISFHRMSSPEEFARAGASGLALAWVLGALLNMVAGSAMTYGVVKDLQGARASIWRCISTGFTRLLPSLGVAFLMSLCIMAGTLALIVPGVILFCALYVAMPVCVLERRGVFGSLGRSFELTRGHRLQIFGLCLLLGLIMFAFVLLFGMIVGVGAASITSATDGGAVPSSGFFLLGICMNFVMQMIAGSLIAVMTSVAYYHLRAEKDGTSAAELAAIFD